MIYWTNLLTRATVPAACFLLFLVPGKSENEYSRNWTGQKPKFIFFRKTHGARIRDGGGPGHGLAALVRFSGSPLDFVSPMVKY